MWFPFIPIPATPMYVDCPFTIPYTEKGLQPQGPLWLCTPVLFFCGWFFLQCLIHTTPCTAPWVPSCSSVPAIIPLCWVLLYCWHPLNLVHLITTYWHFLPTFTCAHCWHAVPSALFFCADCRFVPSCVHGCVTFPLPTPPPACFVGSIYIFYDMFCGL